MHIYIYIYIYIHTLTYYYFYYYDYPRARGLHPAAVRRDMVLHQTFRARGVRKTGIGGEARHGVTSGVSCETSKT